jgi:exosortase/archaeosortase family protein
VIVFGVTVLGLLFGYRFVIKTTFNDWYLFKVAEHTGVLLGMIGHSCRLERPELHYDQAEKIRASLAAWKQGADLPGDYAPKGGVQPVLTPWEVYSFRLEEARRRDPGNSVAGPMVSFVFKAGPSELLDDAVEKSIAIRADASLDDATRMQKRREVDQEVDKLRNEVREAANEAKEKGGQNKAKGTSFAFNVIPECGAVDAMSIFFAAVLAFPSRWTRRIIGWAIGIPVLYIVNTLRLACLGVIGAFTNGGPWFKFAHEYVWQGIYVVFVVALWMLWVEFVVRTRREKA